MRQFPFQQLRGAAQAAEWILDLVGQVAHQRPGGVVLGQDMFLAVDAQPPVHLTDFQQQFLWRITLQQGRRRAIDGDDAFRCEGQLQLAFDIGVAVFQAVAQASDEALGADHQLGQRQFVRLAKAQLEQGFRCRVHEGQPQAPVEHHDSDAQTFHDAAIVVSQQHGYLSPGPPDGI